MKPAIISKEPWHSLTQWTSARIALGRAGVSVPTRSVLEFTLDHARARDASHSSLDTGLLRDQLQQAGFGTIEVRSRVRDRAEYLRRPDWGARLCPESQDSLSLPIKPDSGVLTVIVADGLSALASATHALPLLEYLREGLRHWRLDDVIIATQARVALSDEIGEIRGAEAVLILIGERPGLKSPDSLGAYFTYRPRRGRTDSERNCVSNIRPEGLTYELAAKRLLYLLDQARTLGKSGVFLKDDSGGTFGRLTPGQN